MSLTVCRIAFASSDYDAAVDLRRRVLRTPLGLDFTAEQLAAEDGDIHLAAFMDGEMVATVVLTPYGDSTFKLRQMAVSPGHQGQAVGAQLLAAAEETARREAIGRIVLAARVTAQPFYEKYGYEADGEIFSEVTIPHVHMHKAIG